MDANSFNVNVLREKPRIANLLKAKGPLVAPAIAKELNLNSFLASALISELLHDRVLKASTLRIGGGPLYYFPGQETMVENFIQYLPGKEREAFQLIKKEEILEDLKQEPAIRVALRAIKDFAVPAKVFLNNEERLFWRFHSLAREEFDRRMSILMNPQKKEAKMEEKIGVKEEPKQEAKKEMKEEAGEKRQETSEKKSKPRRAVKAKASFDFMVDQWIRENNASVTELSKDGKNANGKISLPGKGEHMLVARNKKSLDELDLVIANQMGLNERLPVILLTNGKLSKKAEEIFGLFRNVSMHRLEDSKTGNA